MSLLGKVENTLNNKNQVRNEIQEIFRKMEDILSNQNELYELKKLKDDLKELWKLVKDSQTLKEVIQKGSSFIVDILDYVDDQMINMWIEKYRLKKLLINT